MNINKTKLKEKKTEEEEEKELFGWKDESKKFEDEIVEPDKYYGERTTFDHQQIIMLALGKCMEAGCKELREGWWEEKFDKMGNATKTYHEDTRKAFVESVKSLLMVVCCDYDKEAKEKIEKLLEEIKARRKFWLEQEWKWWLTLNAAEQEYMTKLGKNVIKGFFNAKLNFDNYFYEEEADLYRQIVSEVSNLTERRGFYEGGTFVG